jgi:hypothetical protein
MTADAGVADAFDAVAVMVIADLLNQVNTLFQQINVVVY